MERRIKSLVRWNAMAMVVRQNKYDAGIGGHISTYASLATLLEVGFNHSSTPSYGDQPGDLVYFQGHASPGVYARAFLEGRLTEEHLKNFRHELRDTPGLSSYPHPWLMPDFWQFPTVSMGLGPINAIYQARFMRYLENRGIIPRHAAPRLGLPRRRRNGRARIDGRHHARLPRKARQPDLRHQLQPAAPRRSGARQRQGHPGTRSRLPRRRLERHQGHLGRATGIRCWRATPPACCKSAWAKCVDGEFQTYISQRRRLHPQELLRQISRAARAGRAPQRRRICPACAAAATIPRKVYTAYKAAVETKGQPTVILAHTIKGYGLGEAGEGRNISHQQKKLNEEEIAQFRSRFEIPIPDEAARNASFYRPPPDSPEMAYLHERRRAAGRLHAQPQPSRPAASRRPPLEYFKESLEGSGGREVSTTMAFVRMLTLLMKHPEIGKRVVPIIPDEARTFGMESLFRQFGIYASQGQLYKPHDAEMFLYYKESKDGQILEEGITEAGSMASFTAAGTAYANYGVEMIPFFIYYSMFGFQRVGDLIWAFADARGKGFLCGGTAGRTTLSGEGLQHQDGHSIVLASTVPTCVTYDPAFAYEIAIIVQDGIRRMYQEQEDLFYYLTLYNENYPMPAMPAGLDPEDVLQAASTASRPPRTARPSSSSSAAARS